MAELLGELAALAFWETAGRAVLHSLWQVAVLGILYGGLRFATRRPEVRYAGAALLLTLAVAWPAFTALDTVPTSTLSFADDEAPPQSSPSDIALSTQNGSRSQPPVRPAKSNAPVFLRTVGAAWQLGALLLLLRLAGRGVHEQRSLLRRSQPLEESVRSQLQGLAEECGIPRVRFAACADSESPCALGVLRPVVLFPLSTLTGFSPSQLEALALHELAHVRRHDYLANVLQSVAEALLFFHPVARWLSGEMRRERELCCDDWAARHASGLELAEALVSLERQRAPSAQRQSAGLAPAAHGPELAVRVERLLQRASEPSHQHRGDFTMLPTSLSFTPRAAVLAVALALVTLPFLLAPGSSVGAQQPQTEEVLVQAQLLVLERGLAETLSPDWTQLAEVSPTLRMSEFAADELAERVTSSSIDEALLTGAAKVIMVPKLRNRVGETATLSIGDTGFAYRLQTRTQRVGDQLLFDVATEIVRDGSSGPAELLENHLASEDEILAFIAPFVSDHPLISGDGAYEYLLLLSLRTLDPELPAAEREELQQAPFGLVYRPQYRGEALNLSLNNVLLTEVLTALSTGTGLRFELDSEVEPGPVTVQLEQVPWDHALEQILKVNCLAAEVERDGLVRIRKAALPCAARMTERDGRRE